MEVPFPAGEKPGTSRVADWVELQALTGRTAYKRGDLRSAISIEDVAAPDLLEDQVWGEIQTRGEVLGPNWPLKVNGAFLRKRSPAPVDLSYYKYLLCLSLGILEKEDRQLFELLVTNSLQGLTAHPGLRLGAPASHGSDPSFRTRVKQYVEQSGLIVGEEFLRDPLPTDQDMGLDAASWFAFSDKRSGYLHYLVQCATGDDWDTKLSELHLDKWQRHIHWAVTPVRVFSVPFAITALPARWVRLCAEAGLIIDRPRLLELDRRHPLTPGLAGEVADRFAYLTA